MTEKYHVRLIEDRPLTGMWHCGPNAAWVEVTHLPTMISARAFDLSHHHAKQAAMTCCEMMVEQSRLLKCQFPERLASVDGHPQGGDGTAPFMTSAVGTEGTETPKDTSQ